MSRKTGNAQSRATFFRHSAILSLTAVLLRKLLLIFLATCNATMTNKNPFKLQRGCYTQATCLVTLRKVEGRSTFLQLATQQLQLQNGVLHVNFLMQLATQRLLLCKLQEKLLRVTWP